MCIFVFFGWYAQLFVAEAIDNYEDFFFNNSIQKQSLIKKTIRISLKLFHLRLSALVFMNFFYLKRYANQFKFNLSLKNHIM